tara:strand:- start:421 stop:699 length:279 start_codon:yes stop_codon:yes gene_type:complete
MLKEGVVITLGNKEIIEKTASGFGNSAHIVISKQYLNKNIKIVIGKSKIKGNKINIDFSNAEILNRKSTKFGTGCHVIIPKEYVGKEVKIII